MNYYTRTARRIDNLALGLTDEQIGKVMSIISPGGEKISIRRIAALIGKSPSTVARWKTTNPHLFKAVSEYVSRHTANH